MHADVLIISVVLLIAVCIPGCLLQPTRPHSSPCQLSVRESERQCQSQDGLTCSGQGWCDCGRCVCPVSEPGRFYGSRCECQDWVCEGYNGKVCGGHGKCNCGKCRCNRSWFGNACQYPKTCSIPRRRSNEMCQIADGLICSNAGTCHCGTCICSNSGNDNFIYGKFCECNDENCIDDETGEICGGHGACYCGNCYCMPGWHGDKCDYECDITPWESKRKCTSPGGQTCSNRGNCICGACVCYDLDPSGEYGDIHGETCECDERDCHAVHDRYSDSYCSGKCECGICSCFPPGDLRVHGKLCECDDRQCEDSEGIICGGNGICSCGRCICDNDWFGKHCENPRTCSLTEQQSRSLCESPDGFICSGKGSCHCGRCMCGSPQQWYISGEFCECDDRQCDEYQGVICTGNGVCNCGICDCWVEWTGTACEIWIGSESF